MVRRNTGTGRRDRVPVVDPAVLAPSEPVSGLAVRTPFRLGGRRLEPLDVERGSGWHRREGTVYGWVRAGSGRIEHGTDDAGRAALTAGAFLRVPAGLPHRHVPGTSRSNCWSSSTPTARPTRRAAGRDRRRDRRGQQDRCGTGRAGGTAEVGTGVEVVGPDGPVPAVGSPNLVRETPFPGRIAPVMRVRAAGGAGAGGGRRGRGLAPPRRERLLRVRRRRPERDRVRPGRPRGRTHRDEVFHVPPGGLVHRDTNPTEEAHAGIIRLCGGEPWVVNVEVGG